MQLKTEKRMPPARRAALGGVVTALTVASLYLAAILPAGRAAWYFVASLLVAALLCEGEPLLATLCFAASTLLGVLVLPNPFSVWPYAAVLGWYGIAKYGAEKLRKPLEWTVKLLCCNGGLIAAILILDFVFGIKVLAFSWPAWGYALAAVGMQAVFVAYDVLYSFCVSYYLQKLRPHLFRS